MKFAPFSLIVTDKDYFPLLFHYRSLHPEDAMKWIDEEGLIDRANFRFAKSPIPALLRQGMDYVEAKKWMKVLRVADLGKNARAKALFDAIPKECIEVDPVGDYELRRGNIYLLEMEEDVAIHALLKRKGYAVQDIHLADLGLEERNPLKKDGRYVLFKNKFEQFRYLFASIRNDLLAKTIKPEDVRIQVADEGDGFYLNLLGRIYGVPVRIDVAVPLFSQPKIADAMTLIHERGTFDLSGIDEETAAVLRCFIDSYGLETLPFSLAYSSLYEMLAATKEKTPLSPSGIAATSSFAFSPAKRVYVTCLQYGPFHNVYADDDVLPDAELLSLGVNPSYVKTALERRKKTNFLRYHSFALLSRVKEHLDEKLYDSQFIEEWDWKPIDPPEDFAGETLASKRLRVAVTYDRAFLTEQRDEYRSYDSSFQGLSSYDPKKKSWSVTGLESYVRCPYRYYLKSLLPKETDDRRSPFIGTMVHKVLERLYEPGYDLEKALQEGKLAYEENREKAGVAKEPSDEVYMALAESSLRRYVPLMRDQLSHASIVKTNSEYPLTWTLSDDKGSYSFFGRIDAVLLAQGEGIKYYVLLDYKSGAEALHPYEAFLGSSTQLPLYAYGLKQNGYGEANQAVFGGIGLKKVAFSSTYTALKQDSHNALTLSNAYKSLQANGAYPADVSFWKAFDDTGYKSDKKKGESPTGKGTYFHAGEALFDVHGEGHLSMIKGARAYGWNEWIDDAKMATLETIHHIERGEFPIAPTGSDLRASPSLDRLTCRYCPYKDVCYRVLSRDVNDLSGQVNDHFKKRKEEDDAL